MLCSPWSWIPLLSQSSVESLEAHWRVHVRRKKLGSLVSEGWWCHHRRVWLHSPAWEDRGKNYSFPVIPSSIWAASGRCHPLLMERVLPRDGDPSWFHIIPSWWPRLTMALRHHMNHFESLNPLQYHLLYSILPLVVKWTQTLRCMKLEENTALKTTLYPWLTNQHKPSMWCRYPVVVALACFTFHSFSYCQMLGNKFQK